MTSPTDIRSLLRVRIRSAAIRAQWVAGVVLLLHPLAANAAPYKLAWSFETSGSRYSYAHIAGFSEKANGECRLILSTRGQAMWGPVLFEQVVLAPDGRLLSRVPWGLQSGMVWGLRQVAAGEDDSWDVVGKVWREGKSFIDGRWLAARISSKGVVLWSTTTMGSTCKFASAERVTRLADGGVLAVGEGAPPPVWIVARYDANGHLVWSKTLGGKHRGPVDVGAVACLPSGEFVVAGGLPNCKERWGYDATVAVLDSDGSCRFVRDWGRTWTGQTADTLHVLPDGAFVVGGAVDARIVKDQYESRSEDSKVALRCFEIDGATRWISYVDETPRMNMSHHRMEPGPSNQLSVYWVSEQNPGGGGAHTLHKSTFVVADGRKLNEEIVEVGEGVKWDLGLPYVSSRGRLFAPTTAGVYENGMQVNGTRAILHCYESTAPLK